MTIPQSDMMNNPDVIVVGAGIAGLVAGWKAKQKGLEPLVLEKTSSVGGLIQSKRMGNCIIEFGPDAFITRKPWAYDLVKELDMEDEIISVNKLDKRVYILKDKNLHNLPDGLRLLVPTNEAKFMKSDLISTSGKERALDENNIPSINSDKDETMASFVTRRLGREMLDRIAEPLLAGVYNGDAHKLSMHSTFPQYPALERNYGSLIEGMKQKITAKSRNTSSIPPLVSFKNGMASLPEKLATELTDSIHLNTEVKRITQDVENSSEYIIETSHGTYQSTNVILALPINIITSILDLDVSNLTQTLNEIEYEGVGSISLIYNKEDVPIELDAYGIVIPAIEERDIDGMQWSNMKWNFRCDEDHHIIRVFYGGPNTRYMLNKSEEEILEIVTAELKDIMGITSEPLEYYNKAWKKAYPQYNLGHKELIQEIKNKMPEGIYLCGNTYSGVGIPDTVKTAIQCINNLKIK